MPPFFALMLWLLSLAGFLFFDPAKPRRLSPALWVPIIWAFILGSRLPSQWLVGQIGQQAQSLEEGSPLDRTISSALILAAIFILFARSFRWKEFLTRNAALIAFLAFALVSTLWSDYPFVAFKRWIRDLGNYLMILVVLSDANPLDAIRMLLRRLSFLLITLSIVLIKYFPELAKQYEIWSGAFSYTGVATSKNMLGMACMVSGLFFFWDILSRWRQRRDRRTSRILMMDAALLSVTLWALILTPSATSRLCLLLGCGVIAATQSKIFRKRPNLVRFGVPAGVVLYGVLVFFFDLNAHIAEAVGRDPTLTDRTKIWKLLLTMDTNPMLGTGYESFWLGSRLLTVWSQFRGLNEAHNGYLEVYLNLGMVGLLMLGAFLIVTYSRVGKLLKRFESFGSLSLAFWTVLIFYSITEVGFRSGLMWFAFLLGAISLRRAPNDDCRTAGKGGQSRNNARLEASLFTFVPTRDYYGASHPIS